MKVIKHDCPRWKAEPLEDRLVNCLRMLSIHGAATSSEVDRIARRIAKILHEREKDAKKDA